VRVKEMKKIYQSLARIVPCFLTRGVIVCGGITKH